MREIERRVIDQRRSSLAASCSRIVHFSADSQFALSLQQLSCLRSCNNSCAICTIVRDVSFQECALNKSTTLLFLFSICSGFSTKYLIFDVHAFTSHGSRYSQKSPPASVKLPALELIQNFPKAKLSTTGSPHPSYK